MSTAAPGSPGILPGRRRRGRRTAIGSAALATLLVVLLVVSLCVGATVYSPGEVLRVILGERVPGASFTVGTLRLPRAITAALVGIAFGLAGVIFQTMLRNVLASPDVIGITSGSSAAAVIAIGFFGLSGGAVALIAVVAGLVTALLIAALAGHGGIAGSRLVLIGIGIGAMLQSVVSFVLTRANITDVQAALRWLTGSLNTAFWEGVPPLALALAVLVPAALLLGGRLSVLQLGDESATALGAHPGRSRLLLILVAVGLAAVATAATGPIAFVAFLSGPIARRLVPDARSPLLPAALVGAVIVLAADLIAQYGGSALFEGVRFPVGVVTGAVGAPFLLWLLARRNRTGGTL